MAILELKHLVQLARRALTSWHHVSLAFGVTVMVIYQSSSSSFLERVPLKVAQVLRRPPQGSWTMGIAGAALLGVCIHHLTTSRENELFTSSIIKLVCEYIQQKFGRADLRAELPPSSENSEASPGESHENEIVTHKGSCDCESISFQVVAPQILKVHEGKGKILYPQTRVAVTHFTLIYGEEYLRVYHVRGRQETIAYSFCRNCAVHVINATDSDESTLAINVNCLRPETVQRIDMEQPHDKALGMSHSPTFPYRYKRKSTSYHPSVSDLESVEEDSAMWRNLPSVEVHTPTRSRKDESRQEDMHLEAHSESPISIGGIGGIAGKTIEAKLDSEWLTETDSTYSGFTSDTGAYETTSDSLSLDGASTLSSMADPAMRDKLRRYMKKHLKSKEEVASCTRTHV